MHALVLVMSVLDADQSVLRCLRSSRSRRSAVGRSTMGSHQPQKIRGRSNLPVLTTINYMQPWPTHLPPASSAPRRRRPRPASLPARRRQAGLPLLAQQPPLRRHLPVRAAAGEDGADRAARRGEEGGAEVGAAAAVAGGVGDL